MNLIYACVFYQESYIKLLELLLESLCIYGNINQSSTDILIMTTSKFQKSIEEIGIKHKLNLKYHIFNVNSLFEAGCARLNLFNYENINKYNKILYLDTDILINNDINKIFNLDIDNNKIYGLEEGIIGHEYWGNQFFDFNKFDRNMPAFTSGILFFANSEIIQNLFKNINEHINTYIYINKNPIPICLDQPFIVYNSIKDYNYNNQVLKDYAEDNPKIVGSKVIYHFSGGPGDYSSKYSKMSDFLNKMKNKY